MHHPFFRFTTSLAVASLFAVLVSAEPGLPRAAPWKRIGAGPYSVGYRVAAERDRSRASFTHPGTGRPILIEMWHPARPGTGRAMALERYVRDEARLDGRHADAEEIGRAMERFRASNPIESGTRADLNALLSTPAAARLDAPFARGRFPLVLYFHTPAIAKSVQCEFLASQGFIVVSTPVLGTFEPDLDVAVSGAETQARDLEFADGWATRAAPVDSSRVGIVGMSFGGISELLFAFRHPEVKAIVSLDGGAGSTSGAATVRQSPYFEPARIRAPILHAYQPEGADLELLESLRYAPRTFAKFPALRHGDFSGSGFLKDFALTGRSPRTAARASLNRWVARFLRAHLTGDAESRRLMDQAQAGDANDPAFVVVHRRPVAAPPLYEDLKRIIRDRGVPGMVAELERLRDQDPTPFSEETFRKLGSWMFDEGKNAEARSLFDLQVAMYPDSARAHFFLALAARSLADKPAARDHFTRAIALLSTDPALDAAIRRRIEITAKESLSALGIKGDAP